MDYWARYNVKVNECPWCGNVPRVFIEPFWTHYCDESPPDARRVRVACKCGCKGQTFESEHLDDLRRPIGVEEPEYEAKASWNANQIEFTQPELVIELPRLHWVVARQYAPHPRFPHTASLATGAMTVRLSRLRGVDLHMLRRLKFVVPQFVTDRFEADHFGRITDIPPFRFTLVENEYARHLVSLTKVVKNLASLGGSDFYFDIHRTTESLGMERKSRKKFVDQDWLEQKTPMAPVTLKVFEKLSECDPDDEEEE